MSGYSYRPMPTNYPWDSTYEPYPNPVTPKYQVNGNMEYPYWVRRHRNPKVFSDPKPIEYSDPSGYTYQIPEYPPYVYWYPNPMECRDSCGTKVCNEHYRRVNNYRMCQRCQSLKKPMCWNSEAQKCVACSPRQALSPCEDSFGCRNPNGWLQSNVAPIDPKYTGCRMCN